MNAARVGRFSTAAVVCAATLLLGGCSGDDSPDDGGDGPAGDPSGTAAGGDTVQLKADLGKVSGRLKPKAAEKVVAQVAPVVDGWFEAAYLSGDYPRKDFAQAFPGFTKGAADDAKRDAALMTNKDIGGDIDSVSAQIKEVACRSPGRGPEGGWSDGAVHARVQDRGQLCEAGQREGTVVPDQGGRRQVASLRLQGHEVLQVRAGTHRTARAGAPACPQDGGALERARRDAARRTRRVGVARRDRADQDRASRRDRPEPRRHLDHGDRLRCQTWRGDDPQPRRRAPAGRHQHADRCGGDDRHTPRLVRRHPRARQQQDQRRAHLWRSRS